MATKVRLRIEEIR